MSCLLETYNKINFKSPLTPLYKVGNQPNLDRRNFLPLQREARRDFKR
jgi:hypothetical protein